MGYSPPGRKESVMIEQLTHTHTHTHTHTRGINCSAPNTVRHRSVLKEKKKLFFQKENFSKEMRRSGFDSSGSTYFYEQRTSHCNNFKEY